VRFLAYTGLRWGEETGLTVADVEVSRRRLNISSNAVIVNGHVIVGAPKTHERCTVVHSTFLDAAVAHAVMLKRPDELIFPTKTGGYLRPGNSKSGGSPGRANALGGKTHRSPLRRACVERRFVRSCRE